MSSQTPLLKELLEICSKKNIQESKAYLAFQTYLELCEVEKLWLVEYIFLEPLKRFGFTAKRKKTDTKSEVYVPIMTSEEISITDVETIQQLFSPEEYSIVLAIKDRDSSTVYYRITQGLVEPCSPEVIQKRKEEEAQKFVLENEISKNKMKIFALGLKSQTADVKE